MPIPSIPSALVTGSHILCDLRPGANWYDNGDGTLNVGGDATVLSEADKDNVAALGFAYLLGNRGLTNTGQTRLGELVARNPNFRWIAYFWINHVRVQRPIGDSIPLQAWEVDNIPPALDVDGNPVVNWYQAGNPALPPLLYTANLCFPQTGGALFNKTLVDAWLQTIADAILAADYPPIGIMWDYFMQRAAGPPSFPGEPWVDLDQDGVPYNLDSAEQDAFQAVQLYACTRMRALLGEDFIITANGRAPYINQTGETALQAELHGHFFEYFPNSVWAEGPANVLDQLHRESSSSNYRTLGGVQVRRWSNHGIETLDFTLAAGASLIVDANRIGALMWDGWHFYAPAQMLGTWRSAEIVDQVYLAWHAALGAATGPATRVGDLSGTHSYERDFANGRTVITIDPTRSGNAQVIAAYVEITVEEGYPMVTATTNVVSTSGTYLVVSGTVATENNPGRYWIEYGTDADLTTYAATAAVAFDGSGASVGVFVVVPDVRWSQLYYARVCAEATGGPVSRGAILSATTGPLMASRIDDAVDYLVARIKTVAGHTRVYPRRRMIRDREQLETLLVGPEGLNFWELYSATGQNAWAGTQSVDVPHTVTAVLRRAMTDGDAPEIEQAVRDEAEAVAADLRWDYELGGNVEGSQVLSVQIDDATYAGVTVMMATLTVQATEHLRRP